MNNTCEYCGMPVNTLCGRTDCTKRRISADTTAFDMIIAKRDKRDWSSLPSTFERDAVKAAFADMKPHFSKQDIRRRIKASKARTFAELRGLFV